MSYSSRNNAFKGPHYAKPALCQGIVRRARVPSRAIKRLRPACAASQPRASLLPTPSLRSCRLSYPRPSPFVPLRLISLLHFPLLFIPHLPFIILPLCRTPAGPATAISAYQYDNLSFARRHIRRVPGSSPHIKVIAIACAADGHLTTTLIIAVLILLSFRCGKDACRAEPLSLNRS